MTTSYRLNKIDDTLSTNTGLLVNTTLLLLIRIHPSWPLSVSFINFPQLHIYPIRTNIINISNLPSHNTYIYPPKQICITSRISPCTLYNKALTPRVYPFHQQDIFRSIRNIVWFGYAWTSSFVPPASCTYAQYPWTGTCHCATRCDSDEIKHVVASRSKSSSYGCFPLPWACLYVLCTPRYVCAGIAQLKLLTDLSS